MLGRAVAIAFADQSVVPAGLSELNITDQAQVTTAVERLRPDVIVNCAALTAVDECERREDDANRVNAEAVGFLARAAQRAGAAIVHVSTDYVFDGQQAGGYAEDARPSPINAYGRSKALGERRLHESGASAYLVRTSWLFGPDGRHFIGAILRQAATSTELRVVDDQHGKPSYAPDVAGFIRRLVDDRAPYGTYHAVNEPPTTWYDLARETVRLAGLTIAVRPCRTADVPRPAPRPTWSILLNTKRPPLRPWGEALRDFLGRVR